MFPGGMNPKQMAQMMKQLGIKTEELSPKKIVMEFDGGRKFVFENPQVQCMTVQGKKTYTVIGDPIEEKEIPSEDIEMVAEQASVTKEKAKKALEKTSGDIAQAILDLKE